MLNYKSFIENPVKVSMFFLALVLLGLLSYKKLPVNLFPDIRTPRITVVATTKSLTPEEAEKSLTQDIERQLSSIKGVSSLTSYSRAKHIVIHVDFHWGQDMEFAYLDIKKSLGGFANNEKVENIEVYRFDPNSAPLMTLIFSGDVNRIQLTSFIENNLKPKLETIEGVAYIKANGISRPEVVVKTNEDVMAQYNLTADSIIQEIQNSNINVPGGVLIEGNKEMELKFVSQLKNLEDIKKCVVTVIDNHPIHLEEVGEVTIKKSKDNVKVLHNGKITIGLDVFKEPDANAVATAKRVQESVKKFNSGSGHNLIVAIDRSKEIESAIGEVVETALIGMTLAMIILFLFLRNISATLIIGTAIPISIIATFCLMYFQKLSLNIMTLGGLALGAGMLVDNGIVVMENIFRCRQKGMSPKEAAIIGTKEVAMAITAATLTTIVVFVPLVYVHGIAGILFKDQALTVVYSLLMSLLVALVLIPMLSSRAGSAKIKPPSKFNEIYGTFLKQSMKFKWILFLLFIATMWITWEKGKEIPSEFFPESVQGRLSVVMEMPIGTSLEETEKVVQNLESYLSRIQFLDPKLSPLLSAYLEWQSGGRKEDFINKSVAFYKMNFEEKEISPQYHLLFETIISKSFQSQEGEKEANIIRDLLEPLVIVKSFTSSLGMEPDSILAADEKIFGSHSARMDIMINQAVLREFTPSDLSLLLLKEAEKNPNLKVTFETKNDFLQLLLGKNRGDVVIEVHAEKGDELKKTGLSVLENFQTIPGLANERINLIYGENEYLLIPERDALSKGQFKMEEIMRQTTSFLEGKKSDTLRLEKGDMVLSLNSSKLHDAGIDDLLNLIIISSQGTQERLGNLVKVQMGRGIEEVMRVNQEKTLLVMADLEGITYSQAITNIQNNLDKMDWISGATWNVSGEEVKRKESFNKLFIALMVAIALVYMVIASILESLIHPLTIMIAVPLALAGVVAAFYLTGVNLNLMGYIGIVMLAGIVVNDAIVLLDRIHQIRDKGEKILDAVVLAGRQRLRPILMTSLTTILALYPLALGFGNGAELRKPLAVAVIGGLVSSTLLTLWILPGLYLCVEDIKKLVLKPFKYLKENKTKAI